MARRTGFPTFAARNLFIRTKAGSIAPFRLNAVQRTLHTRIEAQRARTGRVRMLVLKARQPGVSTYVEGRFYWLVTRGRGMRAFILTHMRDATDAIFEMVERFHARSPDPEKPHVGAANASELLFDEIDSGYRVGTAGSRAVGRGHTIQLFHGSEVAHWPNGGAFPAITHERALDKLTMLVQELGGRQGRALAYPVFDPQGLAAVLPGAAARASRYLAFDAAGEPMATSGPAGDSAIPVSPFIETLLDDADAAAARTTLGLGAAAVRDVAAGGTGELLREDGDGSQLTGIAGEAGQCRLVLDGGSLKLSPFNGNRLAIDGAARTVPWPGVALSPAGLSADTTFYIYAFMDEGTMTLEASETARATHTNGVEIKSGDATRTLVGLARTVDDGGAAWVDSPTRRFVRSWFNDPGILGEGAFSANRSTTSTSPVELHTEIRVNFLSWEDEIVTLHFVGESRTASSGWPVNTQVRIDGAATNLRNSERNGGGDTDDGWGNSSMSGAVNNLNEGTHYATIFGATNSGSVTVRWVGSETLGTRRCVLQVNAKR